MRRFSSISAVSALFRRAREQCAKKWRSGVFLLPALLLASAALCATPEHSRRPANRAKPPAQEVNPPPAQQPAPANPAPTNPAPEATAPQPPARAPVDVDPDKLQPFNLPTASRQRMRKCGEEWRDLKAAGKSAGLTWRSFAEKCLPGQD